MGGEVCLKDGYKGKAGHGSMNKFGRNQVWSVGLAVSDGSFRLGQTLPEPKFVLNSRRLRLSRGHVHTYADPFLLVKDDALYVFYEKQAVGGHGVIEAYRSTDLATFQPLGEVLREPFHVSYPFVFHSGDDVYLVPETYRNNEVGLYKFSEFPNGLVRQRTLIRGKYQDPSVLFHQGHWYLFATRADRLDLFVSDDIEFGEFKPHPCNPVSEGLRLSQCGGGVFLRDGSLYRVAQDRTVEYGKNIHVLKIDELSPTEYRETLVIEDYLAGNQSWNSRGGHHLSIAEFLGKTVIATDGKQNDLFVNRILSIAWRLSALAARAGKFMRARISPRPVGSRSEPHPELSQPAVVKIRN
jgi:hypothetical protein